MSRRPPPTPATSPPRPPAPAPAPPDPRGLVRVGHVESIDGLRCLAVVGVMATHAHWPLGEFGFVGVDLFFVLSGFLITTLLVQERRRSGRVSLLKFWGRRFLRLMPAYWLYVGLLTAAMLMGIGGTLTAARGWSPGAYIASLWGYFVNYAPQKGIWPGQKLMIHLWSLAVEEQFYLFWPVVCMLALRLRRPSVVAWLLVAGVVAYRAAVPDAELHGKLYTRGFGIILGCAVGLAMTEVRGSWARRVVDSRLLRGLVAGAALVLALGVSLALRSGRMSEDQVQRLVIPPIDILFALLVALLWYGRPDGLSRLLSWRPAVYVGKISYGVYLYHMAALLLAQRFRPALDPLPRPLRFGLVQAAFVALTLLFAAASYHLYESRFLALKDRLR